MISLIEEKLGAIKISGGVNIKEAIESMRNCIKMKIDQESSEEGRYIFQMKDEKPFVNICDLKLKKIIQKEIDFKFPLDKSFCLVKENCYVAGGIVDKELTDKAWRVSFQGKTGSLCPMPVKKRWFPITYNPTKNSLITVGGQVSLYRNINETTIYSLEKDTWGALAPFPHQIRNSSLCVLNGKWLYNFGGIGSDRQVARLSVTNENQAEKWNKIIIKDINLHPQWLLNSVVQNHCDKIYVVAPLNFKETLILEEDK